MPAPSQVTLLQSQTGPGIVSGPGLSVVFGGVSASSSSGGLTSADWASLLALDASSLPTGTSVFVETFKESFLLDKTSSADLQTYVVGTAIGGGRWLRSSQPSPYWIYVSDYYVDPLNSSASASDENLGSSIGAPLASLDEWKRRCLQPFISNISMTVHLLSDSVADFAFDQSVLGGLGSVQWEGSLGKVKVLDNAVITAVTVADPIVGGPGGTKGTVTIAGSFASSNHKIGIVNAGPRAGATFPIYDLGGGVAHVGNVGTGSFNVNDVTLQIGDTFDTWAFPKVGGTVLMLGSAYPQGVSFVQLEVGPSIDGITCTNSSVVELDACVIHSLSAADAFVQTYNCAILGLVDTLQGAIIYLRGGMLFNDALTSHGSLLYYIYVTFQGGSMRFDEGQGTKIVFSSGPDPGWVGVFDAVNPVVIVTQGAQFILGSNARLYGQNCSSPRITVNTSGTFSYNGANKPNLIGSGAVDVLLTGVARTFAEVPAMGVDALSSFASDTSTGTIEIVGGPPAYATALRETPVTSVTTTGAQNMDLSKTNSHQILAALTGDTAITWTSLPSADATPHAQDWTLRYSPATHHATFPNTTFPTVPASLNAAALATAETTASRVLISFHCASDGLVSVASWTAS